MCHLQGLPVHSQTNIQSTTATDLARYQNWGMLIGQEKKVTIKKDLSKKKWYIYI